MEQTNNNKKPETKPKPVKSSISPKEGNSLIEALLKHDKALDETLSHLDTETSQAERKLSELENILKELETKSEEYDEEIATLENKTRSEETSDIQRYLAIYERLKSDEKAFKASCNEELERLQAELASHDEVTDANKAELQAQLVKYKERNEMGRVELAGINRKVAVLKRQVEQVPNRMELREYRLRFSELYNQVSSTYNSTQRFYSLYNSLEDTKRYLEKELSLLNSVIDSFQLVIGSPSGREDFLRQLQTTHDGMKDTCSKVEKRFNSEKLSVEKMQLHIQKLLDMKVAYEKTLKELEAECKRNDQLLEEYKALEKAAQPTRKLENQEDI